QRRQLGHPVGHRHRLAALLRHRLGADPRRPVPLLGTAEHLYVLDRVPEPAPGLRLGDRRGDLRARARGHYRLPGPRLPGGVMLGRLARSGYHCVMILVSLLWLGPIIWVAVMSTRTFDDIATNGVGSLPHSFTLDTYRQAWTDGGQLQALINSMAVTLP